MNGYLRKHVNYVVDPNKVQIGVLKQSEKIVLTQV